MTPSEDNYEDLPRAVIERLESQQRSVVLITPQVDGEITRLAQAHFADRSSSRRSTRRWALPAAVAATVASVTLAVFLVRPVNQLSNNILADDIDGSGQVDVLDAFALTRMSAASNRIDQREIDQLMARIVSLNAAGGTL